MRSIPRTILVLLAVLALSTPAALRAQEPEPAPVPPSADADAPAAEPVASPEVPEATSSADPGAAPAPGSRTGREYEIRNSLYRLIASHRPGLGTTLAFHPDLLSDESFLAGYPTLAAFLDEHPEVRRDPYFYLSQFQLHYGDPLDALLEGLAILGSIALVAMALAWLIRTWIEQRRWNRLSKNQIEVHNRILDRFGSSEELLEYVRTSAGTRFLEAAPISVQTERASSPQSRVVRSVQIGVIVAAAALGTLLISGRFDDEGSQVLFALGVIALSIGVGFIGSAAVTNVLSQRLGLWEPARPARSAASEVGDEIVR